MVGGHGQRLANGNTLGLVVMGANRISMGYCYVTRAELSLPRAEWQERIEKAVKAGGFRRVEAGETFIHAKGGRMLAEIYANVPLLCAVETRAARLAQSVTAALFREPS